MIDQKFIEKLPEEFNKGTMYFINSFIEFDHLIKKMMTVPVRKNPRENINISILLEKEKLKRYEEYIEYYYSIEAYLKANKHKQTFLSLGVDKNKNIVDIIKFYENLKIEFDKRSTSDHNEETKMKYELMFNNVFSYEFSQGDVDRIQQLLNELRDLIVNSELFTAEHKQRILKRLEKLQSELHKKVSDLDRFWGLIGDAGVAIGKFGNDAKPFVDRIKEIADIVWTTQARTEELPSGTNIPILTDGKIGTGNKN